MRGELPGGTVTLVFTDVEGSTALLDRLGAERYAAALADHRRILRQAVSARGGVEVDTQGDAFFFAFQTAGAALEAVGNAQADLTAGPIRVRIGVHTGSPLVTSEGYVGMDVHRAARLAAAAHGGQVVVSASCAALVDATATGLRDLGEHRLKSLAAVERVYQLGGEAFPPLDSLPGTPPSGDPTDGIVGRETELATLQRFLDGAARGPRMLVLEGPPGIGKTTLFRAAAALAARQGAGVLRAQAAEAEAGLPFGVLSDLLAPVLDAVLDELPEPQARALRVALLLDDDPAPLDRRAVGNGLLGAVRLLAARRPLLVAVDDVQWVDTPSADSLWFVARRLEREPVGIVLARRLEGPAEIPPPAVRSVLPSGSLERLAPRPLDLDALHAVLRSLLGRALPPATLRRAHDLCAGNPYFAVEIARALAEAGEPADGLLRVPDDVRVLLRRRLDALSPAAREVTVAAAALAQPTLQLLAALGCRDAAVREALDAEIVELADERLRFTHPLLASVAYDSQDGHERRALHRRLADVAGEPEERARHLALASDGPDPSVAAVLDDAAEAARERGAPAAAAELLERARVLTPTSAPAEVRRRALAAAIAHFEAGDSARARALLEEEISELPGGAKRGAALVWLARVRSYDDDLREAGALYERAIGEAGEDELVLAQAHEGVASTLFRLRERLSDAVGHAESAAQLAAAGNADDLVAMSLASQAAAEGALGRPEAMRTGELALAHPGAGAIARVLGHPAFPVAVVRFWHGDAAGARAEFERLLERSAELGDESSVPYLRVMLGQVDCALGRFADAAREAGRGAIAAEQVGQQTLLAYALSIGALADAHAGCEETARSTGERALELAERTSGIPAQLFAAWALGHLDLSLGAALPAVSRLAPLLAHRRREHVFEPGATPYLADGVEALVAAGHLDHARSELESFEAEAQRLQRGRALAQAARCRGLLLAAGGDEDGSQRTLEAAVRLAAALDAPFEHARALHALGGTGLGGRDPAGASRALTHAGELFDAVGASIWAERARVELRRL